MRPLKLAVIGGGPSAFYVASRVLQLLPRFPALRIHIYDRLWAPYGLVRYGVAPDHPEVKNCTHKFDITASDPRVRFFGNVNIGNAPPPSISHAVPLPLSSLLPHYTHLLFATGSPVPRTLPSILPHAIPAINIVHWYTRHPAVEAASPIPLGATHVTIVGLGNVSLDIARMLLTPPSELAHFDVPKHVLKGLEKIWGTLKHVAIVGRRGPREARWSPKEMRELFGLKQARMRPLPVQVIEDARGQGGTMTRQEGRLLQLLEKGSVVAPVDAPKSFSIEFWKAPAGEAKGGHGVVLEDTRTGGLDVMQTDAVVSSFGFMGDPEPFAAARPEWSGFDWFDQATQRVRHVESRVVNREGEVARNVYTSGWAAGGARGVIAGTVMDAKAVGETIVSDLESDGEDWMEVLPKEVEDLESIPEEVRERKGEVVSWREWLKVDSEEKRRAGETKERERMAWQDVTAFLDQGTN